MKPDDLEERAKVFGIRVLKLVDALPDTIAGRVVAHQLAKAGTSVGANYRAARRARSKNEFRSKLSIVVEEVDESEYWLEMIIRSEMIAADRVQPLYEEAGELTKIFAKMRRTAFKD